MIKFALQGISVNDETLAVDAIHRAGPGGDFMLDDQTVALMRTIGSQAGLLDRNNRANWELTCEGKDMAQRATEKACAILDNHQPSLPLSKDVLSKLHQIVLDAEAEFQEYQEG